MRFCLSIALLVFTCAGLLAQAQGDVTNSEMYKRINGNLDKARAAINAGSEGKKTKADPSLVSSMNGKAFQGMRGGSFNRTTGGSDFRYEQKASPGNYKMTRTFFGIKNPWIGARTYESQKANLNEKGLITNVDRKFTDKNAQTKEFYQAEKKAAKQEDLSIKSDTSFIAKGKTQGSVDKVNERIGKEMTIEQVRDLLNKNHKASASSF